MRKSGSEVDGRFLAQPHEQSVRSLHYCSDGMRGSLLSSFDQPQTEQVGSLTSCDGQAIRTLISVIYYFIFF